MNKYKDSKGQERFSITNNGDITFTYKEAVHKGMSKKQFAAALDDLIDKGFLEMTHQGVGQGISSTFALRENWRDFGTENFVALPPRRKNKDKNSGWNIYNEKRKNGK